MANFARLCAQALFFVAFARSIGPDGFSHFSAAIALSVIISPFIGLGSGSLIVKNCSRDPAKLPAYFGSAIILSGATMLAATPIYAFFIHGSLGSDGLIIAIAVLTSELVATKIQEISVQGFQSQGRIPLVATSIILSSILRISAAVLGYLLAEGDIKFWLILYVSSAVAPAIITTLLFLSEYGIKRRIFLQELFDGFKFSIGISSQGVYNDADKLILPRFISADSSGNYAAAYKIVDVAFSPIRALLTVTYPGFFKAGQSGIHAALQHARKFLPATMLLGFAGSACIYLCSHLALLVLGQEYAETTVVLKYLAIIPMLRSFHFLIADALTGADYQGIRSIAQITVASLNIGLNFAIIPQFGWRGAAIVSIACDTLLCVLLSAIALYLTNREINGSDKRN